MVLLSDDYNQSKIKNHFINYVDETKPWSEDMKSQFCHMLKSGTELEMVKFTSF